MNNCAQKALIDPISLVFYRNGTMFGSGGVVDTINRSTSWFPADSSPQYFLSGGFCRPRDAERATDCGSCDRYHVRLFQLFTTTPTSVGTPHYEEERGCDHVVTTFVGARRALVLALRNAGGAVLGNMTEWGNTEARRQCNGSKVSSDGWQGWLRLTP